MRILLADDERGIRITLSEDLEEAGHEVVAVEDGEQAIRELKRGKFDCMITDLVMPKVDGISLLRFAREQVPDVIAIMITGNATVDRAMEAVRLGAKDVIEKPFNNERVVLLVNNYGEGQTTGRKYEQLVEEVRSDFKIEQMVGSSPQM
jgi:DNA-binding NtrC family response regulator